MFQHEPMLRAKAAVKAFVQSMDPNLSSENEMKGHLPPDQGGETGSAWSCYRTLQAPFELVRMSASSKASLQTQSYSVDHWRGDRYVDVVAETPCLAAGECPRCGHIRVSTEGEIVLGEPR